eukprot:2975028-Prymnesium_polylepis.1
MAEYLEEHKLSEKIQKGINAAVKAKAADPHAFIAATLLTDSPLHEQLPGLRSLLLEPPDAFKKAMGKKTGPSSKWLTDALTKGPGIDPSKPGKSKLSGKAPGTSKKLS